MSSAVFPVSKVPLILPSPSRSGPDSITTTALDSAHLNLFRTIALRANHLASEKLRNGQYILFQVVFLKFSLLS